VLFCSNEYGVPAGKRLCTEDGGVGGMNGMGQVNLGQESKYAAVDSHLGLGGGIGQNMNSISIPLINPMPNQGLMSPISGGINPNSHMNSNQQPVLQPLNMGGVNSGGSLGGGSLGGGSLGGGSLGGGSLGGGSLGGGSLGGGSLGGGMPSASVGLSTVSSIAPTDTTIGTISNVSGVTGEKNDQASRCWI
jgi:hypothetical protein